MKNRTEIAKAYADKILAHLEGKGWVPVVQIRRELALGADNTAGNPAMLTVVNALKRSGRVVDRGQWPSQGDVGKGWSIALTEEAGA